MFNNNLTQDEAKWLIEEYAPKRGGRIDGKTMDTYFVPARSLMIGKPADRPSCGCHFKAFVSMTNSLYNQYESEIKTIAYPPKVKSSGRKAKG